jgi:hypothetical protein
MTDPTPTALAHRIKGLSDRTIAWLFVGPTILLLLAVNIFPLIWTIWLSLTNFRTNRPNNAVEFVGVENYRKILSNPDTWASMQATAHFLVWTITLQVLIGFALAWLINKKFRGNAFARRGGQFLDLPLPAANRTFQLFHRLRIGSGPGQFLDDRGCAAGALGHRDRGYLDVDAVCDADLPCRAALHPAEHL